MLATRPERSPWWDESLLPHALPQAESPLGFDRQALRNYVEAVDRQVPDLTRFANRVVLEPLVPVEGSPLEGRSLGELVAAAGTTAWIGSIAFVHDPIVWIETGGALIVLGAAAGISDGLRRGLSHRIAGWFGATSGPPPDEDES